jgi:hypothetical protein
MPAKDGHHCLDLFRPEVRRVHARIVPNRWGGSNGSVANWFVENRANDSQRFFDLPGAFTTSSRMPQPRTRVLLASMTIMSQRFFCALSGANHCGSTAT